MSALLAFRRRGAVWMFQVAEPPVALACIVASVKAPAVSDVAASEALQLETSIQRLCDGMPATLTQIRVFQRFVAIFEAT